LELKPLISELRVIKSPAEIACIREAGRISGLAHQRLMRMVEPGCFEYQLEAAFVQTTLDAGCRAMAYHPIVAGGENACILHYNQNRAALGKNDLVLVDAGAEFRYYASDITRTYPVNGKFSSEQKALYEVVLAAQSAAMEIIQPGLAWRELQTQIVKTLIDGLLHLKVIKGSQAQWLDKNAYQAFYMHGSGHWIGLDVHDPGDYVDRKNEPRTLMEDMVFTVEPGIYLSKTWEAIDAKWRGIGIRIEDDVVVTTRGHQNLTPEAPKTVEDIEAWIRQ